MSKASHWLVAGFISLVMSFSAMAADVTGTWNLTVETPQGTRNPSMTLTQKGEDVTGTYKGTLGDTPIAGTIKGNVLKLSFSVGSADRSMTINYDGVVEGDTINGKVVMGQMGEGKFSAKKQ